MTDIDDLYEANDREPGEPEPEPLDPERLLEAIDDPQARAWVEVLLANVDHLRGVETRERWAVTAGPDVPPGPAAFEFVTSEMASRHGGGSQLWRRTLAVQPWEPIDSEPF